MPSFFVMFGLPEDCDSRSGDPSVAYSQEMPEDKLSSEAKDRHDSYVKKQAKLNTPSGRYVDIAPIVKTEKERTTDLARFDEAVERLEKRRHRRPHRHY